MTKAKIEVEEKEKPLDAYIMECYKDRYKIPFAALRWAKEIKQKENLPDPLPSLVLRALKEILTGQATVAQVEKLPWAIKIAPQPIPMVQTTPTISLNVDKKEEEGKK